MLYVLYHLPQLTPKQKLLMTSPPYCYLALVSSSISSFGNSKGILLWVTNSFLFGHGLVGRRKTLDARRGISLPVCSLAKFLRDLVSSESSSMIFGISSAPSYVLLYICVFACGGVDSTVAAILSPLNSDTVCKVACQLQCSSTVLA